MAYLVSGKRHFDGRTGKFVEVGEVYSPTPNELKAFPNRFAKVQGNPGNETGGAQIALPAAPAEADITKLSAAAVVRMVKDGEISPEYAIAAEENSDKPRKTLLNKLRKLI